MKVKIKVLNGHYYIFFENGRIDRLEGIKETKDGLSLEQIKAAFEHFGHMSNLEVVF